MIKDLEQFLISQPLIPIAGFLLAAVASYIQFSNWQVARHKMLSDLIHEHEALIYQGLNTALNIEILCVMLNAEVDAINLPALKLRLLGFCAETKKHAGLHQNECQERLAKSPKENRKLKATNHNIMHFQELVNAEKALNASMCSLEKLATSQMEYINQISKIIK